MAYSSIAQSGFLLVGVAAFIPKGVHFMLFYASVYMLATFWFLTTSSTLSPWDLDSLESFSGMGKKIVLAL